MKPQHFAVLTSVLVVMALLLLVTGRPAPEKSRTAVKPVRTVTVVGEGEIRAKPDLVTLTFGVSTWTQGASAAEAEALNLASRDRLIDTLKKAGVNPEEVDASHPLISPLTRQDYAGKTYLTGYQAVSRVVVPVASVQKSDALIAAGLANGATSLEEVTYGLANPEAARQRAVAAAIEGAAGRAAAIVQPAADGLGELVSVEVLEEESPTPRSAASPGALLFRARVKATYNF